MNKRGGPFPRKCVRILVLLGNILPKNLYFAQIIAQLACINASNKRDGGMSMRIKIIFAAVGFAVLSACSANVDGLLGPAMQKRPIELSELPSMNVQRINVVVPKTLTVSEADSLKPAADIVWRGDPYGNRYAQVTKVLQDGLNKGARSIKGSVPVNVNVVLAQFHAQTERVRYTFGGEHEIKFYMEVTNARTGEVVIPTYLVDASFRAYGGAEALEAERNNNGQKVRIENQLAMVIRHELTGSPIGKVP